MPTAISLAQAVTDSVIPFSPPPRASVQGKANCADSCTWFWAAVILLLSPVQVCLGKEEAGEQRKEYICCRSNKQKGLWILLHVHTL